MNPENLTPPQQPTPPLDQQPVAPAAPVGVQPQVAMQQPVMQPAQPVQPVMSVPSTAYGQPKSRKGLFIGLGILGACIVLLLAGLGAWFMTSYISSADYKQAGDAYNKIADLSKQVNLTSVLAANNQSEIDKQVDLANQIEQAYVDMGTLKAVKKDKAIQAAYKDFSAPLYDSTKALKALGKFYSVSASCEEAYTTAAEKSCVADLRSIKDIGSDTMTAYTDAVADKYTKTMENSYYDESDLTRLTSTTIKKLNDMGDAFKSKGEALKVAVEKAQ